MHAVLGSWFDVVKVFPLHEIKRATAVKVIRYGGPLIRVHGIFDLPIRFAYRTSNSQWRFFGGIVQHPQEVAVCVDPMCELVTSSFLRC